ncbi:MAG: putative colanic acid biosynthesis acetyltransferase [Myxococcota bacterium]
MKTASSGLAFFSLANYARRVLWAVMHPLFRYSPRHLYAWRNLLLRLMGAQVGTGVKIYPSARCTDPWNLRIGPATVIGWDVTLYALGQIHIGTGCVISQGAHLCAGNHDVNVPGFPLLKEPIAIGNDCWVAAEAFIGPGVTVADRVVVAARAVVTKDCGPGVVVAGNPGRVVKVRGEAVDEND